MADEYEVVELEYCEDDILYYLEDEEGNEVGFVLEEDGAEIECYYEEYDGIEFEIVEDVVSHSNNDACDNAGAEDEEPADRGYLYKMASIAGHEGGKARKAAEEKLDVVRGKAEVQAKKAATVASAEAKKAKGKADEMGLGITREDISSMTDDLNVIAKEGAETAKELKETYDDIMENFGFLVPKKIKRRLP